ncbi:MAG TPA: SpoIID/LytB domain-containing protein [Solirubrobacteraceae bacterium]|jgi:SpoIID/LytB domain protein
MDATYQAPTPVPGGRRRRRTVGCLTLLTALLALAIPAMAAASSTLVIEGAGEGHGVGMSQDGAYGYAQHGATYEQILAHYYTGTALAQAPAKTTVKVLVGSHVKTLGLERYVRGVIGAEMSPSWPAAALEAQAVASRTYALTAHAGGSRFDVYADTRSQVYRGAAAETPATNAAVAATAGQIVTYEGQPAITYFFASSGGMTEDVENGFPGAAPEPWLKGVLDEYDKGSTFEWKTSLSMAAAARSLKGLFKGAFRGIEVLKRGVSPRIVSARVLGTGGSTVVNGPELAGRLGLSSTWAYFSVKAGKSTKHEPDHSEQSHLETPATPTTPQGGVQATVRSSPPRTGSSPSASGGVEAPS